MTGFYELFSEPYNRIFICLCPNILIKYFKSYVVNSVNVQVMTFGLLNIFVLSVLTFMCTCFWTNS